jgi:phosphohistidine phosphatase
MKLYLVQHGEAKSEAEDPRRSLTDQGRKEVEQVAQAAKRLGLHPSKIYHSGKRRAMQTAEILANALRSPVEATLGLNPNNDVRNWADRVSRVKEDLLIVGHLPFLEKLASLLATGDESVRPVLFRYGGIVYLEQKESARWGVRWIFTPEMAGSFGL